MFQCDSLPDYVQDKELALKMELEEMRRQQSRDAYFKKVLGHEMRGQFYVINGYCDLLLHHKKLNRSEEDLEFYAEMIRSSSSYAALVFEELLILDKIGMDTLNDNLQEVNVDELLREVFAFCRLKARSKNMVLTADNHVVEKIMLHPTAIKIILSNLIRNAIKYGPANSVVSVHTEMTSDGLFLLKVCDEGGGIPQGEQEKIFQKYYRGREQKKNTAGFGFGLYSVKKFVETMGGSITVKSNPDEGTVFRVVV